MRLQKTVLSKKRKKKKLTDANLAALPQLGRQKKKKSVAPSHYSKRVPPLPTMPLPKTVVHLPIIQNEWEKRLVSLLIPFRLSNLLIANFFQEASQVDRPTPSTISPTYHGKTPFGDVIIRRSEYEYTTVNGVKMLYRPNRDNWTTVTADGTITAHDKQPSKNKVSQNVSWDVNFFEADFKRRVTEEVAHQHGRQERVAEYMSSAEDVAFFSLAKTADKSVKSTGLQTMNDVRAALIDICESK